MTASARASTSDVPYRQQVAPGDDSMSAPEEVLLVCSRDGRIQSINGPVTALFGSDATTLQGCLWTEQLQGEARQTACQAMQQLQAGDTGPVRFQVPAAVGLPPVHWSCFCPEADIGFVIVVGRAVATADDMLPSPPPVKPATEPATTAAADTAAADMEPAAVTDAERESVRVDYEWDTAADTVVWSGDSEAVLRYPVDGMPATLSGWLALIHPDDCSGDVWARDAVRQTASTPLQTYRVKSGDQSWVCVQDQAVVAAEREGRPTRVRGTLRVASPGGSGSERLTADATPDGALPELGAFAELLQSIVDATPMGILAVDDQQRIRFTNPHLLQTFGYMVGELDGQPVELLLPELSRDRHRLLRDVSHASAAPRPTGHGLSLTGCCRNGAEIPVDVALTPVHTAGGRMVLCTVADRTEHVAAERAILESDRRLNDIIDNTSAVIYLKSLDGRYLLVNRQWEILFGIKRQKMINATDHEVFPEEMAVAFRRNDSLVAASGRLHEFEEIAPHADGPHTYISLKFPLKRSDGTIYGVAGISTDITERIKAERMHSALKHRLELILNSIGDGLYGIDCDGKITFVNSAAERMLGRSAAELCGQDSHVVLHRPQSARDAVLRSVCRVCDVARVGMPTAMEEDCFCRRDGTTFPVEYTSTPVVDDGVMAGSVVTFRDISERIRHKRAEEELRTAQTVQQLLYPHDSPTLDGVDVAGATYPAAMACGDYFDFINTGQDELVLALGDVSGHGLGPALQMVEARAYLRATVDGESDEHQVLTRLNRLLFDDMPPESFLTIILARVDARARSFSYVGAGHNAYLIGADGQVRQLPSTGLVLGLVEHVDMAVSGPHAVEKGDRLLMLSDGLQETMSPDLKLFGMERTFEFIRAHRDHSSADIIEGLYRTSREFAGNDAPVDDVTLVLARFL